MRATILAFIGYTGLAIGLTWPLVADLGGHVMPDLDDTLLNTWILWWNTTAVPFSAAWWNAPAFFPAAGVMTFSELLLGLAPFASPVIWATGSPLIAYNVTLLLTFSLSGTAGYLLGLELTGRRDAAFLGGLAFGFAPYRLGQLGHLQVLASFWMPIALLALHRYFRIAARRWLVVFGVAFLLQALSNGYYLAFFPILTALLCVWCVPLRDWRKLAGVGLVGVLAIAVLTPVLLKYREIHTSYGLRRDIETIQSYSADLAAWLYAPPSLGLWGGLHVYPKAEGTLFTGVLVIALVIAGIALVSATRASEPRTHRGDRSRLVFYGLASLLMYGFALGPSPTLMGEPFAPAGPYSLLMWLPGFDALRVPARFAMLMTLCLSAAAALSYAVLTSTWAIRRRWVVAGLVGAGLVAEGWPARLPTTPAPAPWDIESHEIGRALLVLPIQNHTDDVALMYRAMAHGRPIVNGYSGFEPPWYGLLGERLRAFDPAALDALSEAGVTQVAVRTDHDPNGAWRRYVESSATLRRRSGVGALLLFDLPRIAPDTPPGAPMPVQAIEVSEHASLVPAMTDGDPATFWHSRQPQTGGEKVQIDLGAIRLVSAVETSLGRFADAFPRELVIAESVDAITWREVWRGPGAQRALVALFDGGRLRHLRFPLSGVETRYLRLTQIGRAEQSSWTIAEIVVRGARRP
jgi:hypothetical protein